MTGYLAKRAGQMALTLFLIVTLTFFLVQAQPGDYATFYSLNPDIPAEVRAADQGVVRVGQAAVAAVPGAHEEHAVTGNFGVSFGHYPRPVMEVLAERLPRTVVLFLYGDGGVLLRGVLSGQGDRVAHGAACWSTRRPSRARPCSPRSRRRSR